VENALAHWRAVAGLEWQCGTKMTTDEEEDARLQDPRRKTKKFDLTTTHAFFQGL
jgi:hypothetical protein